VAASKQLEDRARVMRASDHHDVGDARVLEYLQRIEDHLLVVHRQQMLVDCAGQREQTSPIATRENYTLNFRHCFSFFSFNQSILL
jgi:hypothetical protein